ncbi:RNA exonuclease 3 [Aspergillus nanangensis]|uniref:RNA exonuclease 3 n=1 Tax=Aspergillus nanangensis TaxID=2582783 RepID=A0AAD4CUN6_ASPNN|nr:RNA exonuclease 3 [Aspergillus nanangensis]
MFASLGLFKDVPCPQAQQCSLLGCMFSHKATDSSLNDQSATQDVPTARDDTAASVIPRSTPGRQSKQEPKLTPKDRTSLSLKDGGTNLKSTLPSPVVKKPRTTTQVPSKIRTITRDISPPRSKIKPMPPKHDGPVFGSSNQTSRLPPRKAPRESLNPRMLTKAPATHGVRSMILTKLHGAMSALNDKVVKDKESPDKSLVLTRDELVTMALDEEEKTAKSNPSIYSNIIKLRIVKFTKMSREDWTKEVMAHLNDRYYKLTPIQQEKKASVLTTGLSVKDEVVIAKKLLTPLEGLEKHGYVTKPPTSQEIENARKGVVESKGWEKCDRCGGRFQVFPGRREDGSLTTGGQCTHHPGKPIYPPRKKTDHVTGSRDTYFSCCNEPIGTSSGCTKGATHVFKVSETKRLASILQFETTPEQPGKGPQPPVCFDCEMGYTTLGLELIRLTAISWPEGKELLDILVRPMGEVLDLNSRFSGVYPEHYNKAIPYGAPTPKAGSHGETEAGPLQVVESPAAARALLFQFLQPDTLLIGHAIDNDLNTCRIIHPTIIDTVILYPVFGGLPNRMSLKTLARKYLERDIQNRGSSGHDSKEDATATGDLVRVKAAETWKIMKSKGWGLRDGKLIPPPGAKEDDPDEWRLGPGAGQKRTSSSTG